MYELDKVQRIELAKILMNVLERGDWTELLTLTDSEIYLNINKYFLQDVQWKNEGLKQGCITAVNYMLDKNSANLKTIWEFDYVQSSLKKRNLKLFNLLQDKLDGIPNIEIVIPKNATQTMLEALKDAEVLLQENGAEKAIDRIHTSFHDYLKTICDNNQISYTQDDAINKLHKNITIHLENKNIINNRVGSIFKSIGQVIISFNELRNHNSLVHPNIDLLSDADATYVINITQSTVKYLDSLLDTN